MKRIIGIAAIVLLATGLPFTAADENTDSKRANIDEMAQGALDKLFAENASAKELFDKSHGYAVFSNVKVALGVSGSGGSGVAVEKAAGERTYMRMGTAGVGVGLGGEKSHIVILFEEPKLFDNFVANGWQADAEAKASAGTESVGVNAGFVDGKVLYRITKAGLMAHAEVAGTKFWKHKKLNAVE